MLRHASAFSSRLRLLAAPTNGLPGAIGSASVQQMQAASAILIWQETATAGTQFNAGFSTIDAALCGNASAATARHASIRQLLSGHSDLSAPGTGRSSALPLQSRFATSVSPPGPPTPGRHPNKAAPSKEQPADDAPPIPEGAPPGEAPLEAGEGLRIGAAAPYSSENIHEAGVILQHANTAQLREELHALSERQATIGYEHLLQLCTELGGAINHTEAEALAEALCASGVVLRFRTQVYLRPDEIAHSVLQALPDTLHDLETKSAELEAELAPLDQRKQQIDLAAHRRSKAVMWGGFTLLVAQWSVFYWLTWYELSWDVMEPVAYFVSLGTAIGFYLYFLLTNEAFDYQPLQRRLFSRWQRMRLDRDGFDKPRHDRLQADLARYRRYIAHFKRA